MPEPIEPAREPIKSAEPVYLTALQVVEQEPSGARRSARSAQEQHKASAA